MKSAARLEFRQVDKFFPARNRRAERVVAVQRVSFSVARGEVVSLVGPSGCGKSTLLNMAADLDKPNARTVLIDERLEKRSSSGLVAALEPPEESPR